MYKTLFFFFQAEDGIRDVAVTGVQTCALPIYTLTDPEGNIAGATDLLSQTFTGLISNFQDSVSQIGRASCRERV